MALDGGGSDGTESDSQPVDGSFQLDGPIALTAGEISIRYTAPGVPDIAFDALATDLTGYPGSLYLAQTPFGPTALLYGSDPNGAPYTLYVPSVGVLAPLTFSLPGISFVGTVGSATVSVSVTPAIQGPNGTTVGLVRTREGVGTITITAPCNATFKQFFTKKRTWKGTSPNPAGGAPIPRGGGFSGPTVGSGNAQHPHLTDGSTVYVDAPVPGAGDYPNPIHNPDGSTSMTDSPNVTDPGALAGAIQAANPGVTVTEITTEWHFTTYVICAGAIIAKVQWTHIETNKAPFGPPPDVPNGGFGGPNQGPPAPGSPWIDPGPSVTPANGYDPQHQAALTGFQGGTYNGAPSNGGW